MRTAHPIVSVQISPNSATVITLPYRGRKSTLWHLKSRRRLAQLPVRDASSERDPLYNGDGSMVVTIEGQGATLLRSETGTPITTLTGHSAAITMASFDKEGTRLVTSSEDRTVRVWDVNTGGLLWATDQHADAVRASVFSADGSKALSATGDRP